MKTNDIIFLLGGADAEMTEIRNTLLREEVRYLDAQLAWGANFSAYEQELSTIVGDEVIVAVELDDTPEKFAGHEVILIDHHGDRANRPASILQVLELLGLNPTRRQQLIAANDSGFIPAMEDIGASSAEISEIRALDRAAQGITLEQEAEAERAIEAREEDGRLNIVRLAHSKCATVTDRLYGQYDQLIIFSGDGEVNFYGDGALCAELQQKFSGWSGGSGLGRKGASAFWGGYPDHSEILAYVRQWLKEE